MVRRSLNRRNGGKRRRSMRGGSAAQNETTNKVVNAALYFKKKKDEIIRKLREKSPGRIKPSTAEVTELNRLAEKFIEKEFAEGQDGNLLSLLGSIFNKEKIKKIKEDMDKEKKETAIGRFKKSISDIYKIQMLGESIGYQKYMAPAGFRADWSGNNGRITTHVAELNGLLEKIFDNNEGKVIVSNEALNLVKRFKGDNTEEKEDEDDGEEEGIIKAKHGDSGKITHILIDGKQKEVNSFTVKSDRSFEGPKKIEDEDGDIDGMTYIKVEEKYYFTHHGSSYDESERDTKNVTELLTKIIKKIKDTIDDNNWLNKFGGFGGDINLYVMDDNFILKEIKGDEEKNSDEEKKSEEEKKIDE